VRDACSGRYSADAVDAFQIGQAISRCFWRSAFRSVALRSAAPAFGRAPVALEGRSRAAKPDASVVGEKAADAAARIFLETVCITSPGGSQAASKTDWTPFAGRRVLIWPDAGEPGAKYALKVAAILHGQGCDVSIIDAVALASIGSNGGHREPVKGWDAADAVAEWQNLGALRNAAHGLAKGGLTGPEFLCAGGASEGAKDKDEKRPQAVRLIQLPSAAALFNTADGTVTPTSRLTDIARHGRCGRKGSSAG
jgi:hypothetical protein